MSIGIVNDVLAITQAATISASRVMVHQFVWHPAAIDNDLLITDTAGHILYKCRAMGAAPNGEDGYVCSQSINAICLGLIVATLDGGTLYVFTG
jgi:hypothetical protein